MVRTADLADLTGSGRRVDPPRVDFYPALLGFVTNDPSLTGVGTKRGLAVKERTTRGRDRDAATDAAAFDRWRRAAHSGVAPLYVLRLDDGRGPALYVGSEGQIHACRAEARKFSLPADAEVYREELIRRLTAAGNWAYAEAIEDFVVELVSDAGTGDSIYRGGRDAGPEPQV